MIKIENTEVLGIEHAIRGMRNPLNSWDKSDSFYTHIEDVEAPTAPINSTYHVGEHDYTLMKRLVKAGTDHRKFMRMIVVYADLTAPMYWWKEFDTYKVGTVRNSCSTMHKIADKEFELSDFSCEHLQSDSLSVLKSVIYTLNNHRKLFVDKSFDNPKINWWQMIQLLPSSYNQRATVMLNYEVLANMYHSRKNHKLGEWRTFCSWIESLPYAELITGGDN